MGKRLILNETEKKDIRKLYQLTENLNQDYVFDFVLTENNKYLIIMDQLFIAGGNGKSVGSIWEHTYIFNEIINESLNSINTLNESVKENIKEAIQNIKWKKELISEWIKSKELVLEEDKSWYQSAWEGIKDFASGPLVNTVKAVFQQGVIPALRWIRRQLYTNVGAVIDIIVAILAVKTNAIVWLIIVALDVYEIAFDDYDPKDPERMQLPFFYLLTDLIGAVFTGAAALTAKKIAPVVMKKGLKSASPLLSEQMGKILKNLPSLKTKVVSAIKYLEKLFGNVPILNKISRAVGSVFDKLGKFLTRLFSKEGAYAAGTGAAVVYGAAPLIGAGLTSAVPDLADRVVAFDKKAKEITGKGELKISDDEKSAILKSYGY